MVYCYHVSEIIKHSLWYMHCTMHGALANRACVSLRGNSDWHVRVVDSELNCITVLCDR